jgi:hypothetical protein
MYTTKRAFINNIQETLNTLSNLDVEFKGNYNYIDRVYKIVDKFNNPSLSNYKQLDLNDHIAYIRLYEDRYKVELIIKNGKIIARHELTNVNRALEIISSKYAYMLCYKCNCWEFIYNDCNIYINSIMNLKPIVEVSGSNEKIDEVFKLLGVQNILTDTIPQLLFSL